MLAHVRAPGSTTVHHAIGLPEEGSWSGTLCTAGPAGYNLPGLDVRKLEATRKQVTCLRCLRIARKGRF